MKVRKNGYGLLMVLTIVLTLAGVITLIPSAGASKTCLLGYNALCSFTPISTVICFLFAGMLCQIRKKKFTE